MTSDRFAALRADVTAYRATISKTMTMVVQVETLDALLDAADERDRLAAALRTLILACTTSRDDRDLNLECALHDARAALDGMEKP